MNSRSPPCASEAAPEEMLEAHVVQGGRRLGACDAPAELGGFGVGPHPMASAFHRIIDRMRWSMASSRGLSRSSLPGGIVFRYGVVALYGTGAPFLRASVVTSSGR